ncbi:unnamed protein product [Pipistrellus nathusii]|uniref:Uncharacterized protein n=1 Tax=Pipistrellus nathusii TaxID=59473 RepID=A0ABP0A007_PIPNA
MAAMGMGRGAVALMPSLTWELGSGILWGSMLSLNATGVALVHLLLCLEWKIGPWSERGCSELGQGPRAHGDFFGFFSDVCLALQHNFPKVDGKKRWWCQRLKLVYGRTRDLLCFFAQMTGN